MTNGTLYDRATPTRFGFRDVTPGDIAAGRGDARLIDVRQPAEFTGELGHIPGAELVPLGDLLATARAWDREAPLVLVCRSGARSSTGAAQLVNAGFRQVMNLAGGMMAYGASGLPIAR